MNFLESLRIALNAIWINKMRSLLTMLGIIIGIASVIAVVSLGNGSSKAISGELSSFGVNKVSIYHNWSSEVTSKDQMNHGDLEAIRRKFADHIAQASAVWDTNGTFRNKETRKEKSVRLYGANHEYGALQNLDMLKGRFYSEADYKARRLTAVIDSGFAMDIFGREDVVGEKITVMTNAQNITFVVAGVYKPMTSNFGGMDTTPTIYVPLSTLEQMFGIGDEVFTMEVNFKENEDVVDLSNQVKELLERRHKNEGKEKYLVFSMKEQLDSVNNVMGILTTVVGAIAAISLLVGGIGVMNIMLVSVTERTREIGIRKSLGAKHKDILMQFLVESVIISGLGGIIGTLLGLAASFGLGTALKVAPSAEIQTILIAWLFSAGVGVFFGIYPANKAAKLDPIEALRYE